MGPLTNYFTSLRSCLLEHISSGYAFNIKNPEEVINGEKPILEEVGPFIYKAVTVKDSVDHGTDHENLEYNEDGETLTYKQRYSCIEKPNNVLKNI